MTAIGISGHQDLPLHAVEKIRAKMNELLMGQEKPIKGISSLAAGADQLFAESILNHGGSLIAVIPCQNYEVTFAAVTEREKYNHLLQEAVQVIKLDPEEPSEEAFFAAGKKVVEMSDLLVAVWDGKAARGTGGTSEVVEYARYLDKPVCVIWPKGLER